MATLDELVRALEAIPLQAKAADAGRVGRVLIERLPSGVVSVAPDRKATPNKLFWSLYVPILHASGEFLKDDGLHLVPGWAWPTTEAALQKRGFTIVASGTSPKPRSLDRSSIADGLRTLAKRIDGGDVTEKEAVRIEQLLAELHQHGETGLCR